MNYRECTASKMEARYKQVTIECLGCKVEIRMPNDIVMLTASRPMTIGELENLVKLVADNDNYLELILKGVNHVGQIG